MKNKIWRIIGIVAIITIIVVLVVIICIKDKSKDYEDYLTSDIASETKKLAEDIEKSGHTYTVIKTGTTYDCTLSMYNGELDDEEILSAIGGHCDITDDLELRSVYTVIEYVGVPYLVESTDTKVDFFPESGYGVILNVNGTDMFILVDSETEVSYKILGKR